jgi:hypothetical protein
MPPRLGYEPPRGGDPEPDREVNDRIAGVAGEPTGPAGEGNDQAALVPGLVLVVRVRRSRSSRSKQPSQIPCVVDAASGPGARLQPVGP